MLLKMRGLPPKTHYSSIGILAAVDDDTAQLYFETIRISGTDAFIHSIHLFNRGHPSFPYFQRT